MKSRRIFVGENTLVLIFVKINLSFPDSSIILGMTSLLNDETKVLPDNNQKIKNIDSKSIILSESDYFSICLILNHLPKSPKI